MNADNEFLIAEKGGIMFYPNTSVNFIKVNKLELKNDGSDKYNLSSLDEQADPKIREKIGRNAVFFSSFSAIKGYNEDSPERLRAHYFPLNDNNTKIYVYRKEPFQDYYVLLSIIGLNDRELYDYNILNGHYYHYLASAEVPMKDHLTFNNITDVPNDAESIKAYYIYENKDEDGNPVFIQVFFDTWSICDIEEVDSEQHQYKVISEVWNIGYNLEVGDFTQNRGITAQDTLGRFPKISMGKKDYAQGQFKGLLGNFQTYDLWPEYRNINCNNQKSCLKNSDGAYKGNRYIIEKINQALIKSEEEPIIKGNYYGYTEKSNLKDPYALEVEKLNLWKEFIGDGELKLLRDTKGYGWIIQVSSSYDYNINYISNLQQTQVGFTWQEAANINDISIIGED